MGYLPTSANGGSVCVEVFLYCMDFNPDVAAAVRWVFFSLGNDNEVSSYSYRLWIRASEVRSGRAASPNKQPATVSLSLSRDREVTIAPLAATCAYTQRIPLQSSMRLWRKTASYAPPTAGHISQVWNGNNVLSGWCLIYVWSEDLLVYFWLSKSIVDRAVYVTHMFV